MSPREQLRPYAKYLEADGVANVPAHWRTTRVKYVVEFFTGWTPPTGEESYYDGDYPWANISDLKAPVLTSTAQSVSRRAIGEARLRLSPRGSLLFSFKLSVGLVSISGMDLYTNEAIATLVPGPDIDIRYLYWAAPFFIPKNANENIYGAKLLNRELMRDATLIVPPLPEQRAIGAFLDRETAQIDALIAKKERLLALLEERRTALITRAVTKGLDPAVPMKESGVEWLGKVPADWQVVRLRHVLTGLQQGWSPDCENRLAEDDEWGVLKAGCANRGRFEQSEHKALPASLTPLLELEVSPGDVLMSRASGSEELVGSVAYVDACRPRLLLSDKLFRLKPQTRRIDPQFLVAALNSRVARAQIEVEISGAGGLANNIGQQTVRNLFLGLPPVSEQQAIVARLEKANARFARLASHVAEAIALLREYRTALISAAVTGQIDVSSSTAEDDRP